MEADARRKLMQSLLEDSVNLRMDISAGISLDELEARLKQRECTIRAFFEAPVPNEMRAEIKDWIESIQAVDQEALMELQHLKTLALRDFGESRSGLYGARAYQDTLSDSFED